jgi:hypothetical protein
VLLLFIIRDKSYDISREDIEKVLENLDPEPLRGRAKYYIEYKGGRYPIKQVISAVTGLPRIAFTASHAYRILTKLGFEVKQLSSEYEKKVK